MTDIRAISRKIIADLAALKVASTLNAADNATSDRRRCIRYFIDADVLGRSLETPREKQHELDQDSARNRTRLGFYSDNRALLLTTIPADYQISEYIFSGKLPGQVEQLNLSDHHLSEVERIRRAVFDRTPRVRTRRPSSKSHDEKLARMSEQLSLQIVEGARQGIQDRDIIALCDGAVEYTKTLLSPPFETNNPRVFRSIETVLEINRLHDRWKPAKHLKSYVDVTNARSKASVVEWCCRIACARKSVPFQSIDKAYAVYSEFSDRTRETIMNDAKTIVEIISLNEGENEIQNVLITGTESLHIAYANWFIHSGKRLRSNQYYLRQTIQYMPLINLRSFNEVFSLNNRNIEFDSIFRDIVSSLDGFLDPVDRNPSFEATLNIMLVASGVSTKIPPSEFMTILRQIEITRGDFGLKDAGRRWQLAFGNATLITLPVLAGRRREHDDALRAAVAQAGGDLVAAQENIIANLEIRHMASSLVVLKEEIRQELEQLLDGDLLTREVRVVLPWLPDVALEVQAALEGLFSGSIEDAITAKEPDGTMDAAASSRDEDILVSIYMFMSLGSWAQAKRLAAHSILESSRTSNQFGIHKADEIVIRREIRHLYALAVRFDCTSSEDFNKAMDIFGSEIDVEGYENDLLSSRGLIERGTLQLTSAIRQISDRSFRNSKTWHDFHDVKLTGSVNVLLQQSRRDIGEAIRRLKDDESVSFTDEPARDRFLLQASVNYLCAFNMGFLAERDSNDASDSVASLALQCVRDAYEARRELRSVSYLHIDAYRFISGASLEFPTARSANFLQVFTDLDTRDEHKLYRRVVADSDVDVARIYSDLSR